MNPWTILGWAVVAVVALVVAALLLLLATTLFSYYKQRARFYWRHLRTRRRRDDGAPKWTLDEDGEIVRGADPDASFWLVQLVPDEEPLARELIRDANAAEKLAAALREVLADHADRVSAYGELEQQPHRVAVMAAAQSALAAFEAKP